MTRRWSSTEQEAIDALEWLQEAFSASVTAAEDLLAGNSEPAAYESLPVALPEHYRPTARTTIGNPVALEMFNGPQQGPAQGPQQAPVQGPQQAPVPVPQQAPVPVPQQAPAPVPQQAPAPVPQQALVPAWLGVHSWAPRGPGGGPGVTR